MLLCCTESSNGMGNSRRLLVIINTETGSFIELGSFTGFINIEGLAHDGTTMWGVTRRAELLTI